MTNNKRKIVSSRWSIVALCCVAAVALIIAIALLWRPGETKDINTFQTCKDAGGAILESYPEQCMIDGKSFTNSAQSVDGSDGYVNLTEQAALDKAARERTPARVVERDGQALPVTMDFVEGRINLYVKDGKVYKIQIEGKDI